MIIVQFTGGLGNQMFQYALGRRLSLLHDVELKFDLSFYQHDILRDFMLDRFQVNGQVATEKEIEAYTNTPIFALDRPLLDRLVRWGLYRGIVSVSDEPPGKQALMVYNSRVLQAPRNTYVQGYWQSEKYFMPIRQKLLDDFSLVDKADQANGAMLEKIRQCHSVSLHVRRGDYVSNPLTNHSHGTCGLEYYEKAIALIGSKVDDPHFFVFSDDPEWTRDHLKCRFPMTYVTCNSADSCEWDMELMRHCRDHIIANSSFSWWGAWLNMNPDKVVVAPAAWFNNFSADTSDLIPDSWVRI
ncbi:alpha-1,2-fucosyltransferase [Mariprofundus ferrooxydans]|uniref:Alpha-1,2-fucosyltransferase n=1 Tax=Mariprofundus ferrooxydans PV-1 TaxID=314345 RepID=Q0EZ97_9PROT|nr:alpha-1,2-fucosyltransferase [Mariprofundus ferrooxydans]EAU54527.1 alpha-1,2-fucosyltransferase [Mariprofundus ferrooxydans PV-1]KON48854.1 hypothetical protein AL013_00465 [Mariprofundus ferrooxydans]